MNFKTIMLMMLLMLIPICVTMAAEIGYRDQIRPVFDARCAACHGEGSPEYQEWRLDKEGWKAKGIGPKLDSYTHMVYFTGWPDSGALMRRLDDAKPGNMYQYLGDTEAERQANLALFKSWVGNWTTKRFNDLTKEELAGIKVPY